MFACSANRNTLNVPCLPFISKRTTRRAIPGLMAHAGTVATCWTTRQVALITQLLASAAHLAGNVRTQAHVAVFALVSQRTTGVSTRQSGSEAFFSGPFLRLSVGGRRSVVTTTAAGTARGTAIAAVLAGTTGAAVSRRAAVVHLDISRGGRTLRGWCVRIGRSRGLQLVVLRGL